MRALIYTILFFVFSVAGYANPLEKALKEESQILEAQIKQIQKSKNEIQNTKQKALAQLQEEYLREQKKLISLQAQTQKTADELQSLKNDISNFQKMKERVDSSWERLFKIWKDKEAFYQLHSGIKSEQSWLGFKGAGDTLNLTQKKDILQGVLAYLGNSQETREVAANYLDNGDMHAGYVLRVGSLGAQLKDSSLPVVPSEEGVLSKRLEKSQFGSEGVFIFKDLNKAHITMSAGLWDRIVFAMPAAFLVLLFGIVFVLFGLFVKE